MRLYEVLRQYRWAAEKDSGVLAAEIGIDRSTLRRFEHGKMPDAADLALILKWLLEEEAVDEDK